MVREVYRIDGWRARIEVATMPAYYFHVRDHGVLLRDPDGLELPDLDAARDECRKLIVSVLREQRDEELLADRAFQIDDERGRTVLVVPFQLALSFIPVGASLTSKVR